ncbi:hypothetical protein ACFYY2_17455 [Streptomyces sp. NPDC001822]|uniref:hypothetical protein n=1 Tax=Streptomyces sp. NPDC001822 TaxID=3364614 RepID=UPI003696463D
MHTQPLLVDLYAAAVRTGARPATLRVWVHRGHLDHHGYDSEGRVLIDLDAAVRLVEQKAGATRANAA